MEWNKIKSEIYSLVIFRNLLENKILSAFLNLICTLDMEDDAEKVKRYAEFTAQLYKKGNNFTQYILNAVFEDENFYIVNCSQGFETDENIKKCLENELDILRKVSCITSDDIRKSMNYIRFLPSWNISPDIDFKAEYNYRTEHISEHGYGIFAKYYMFVIKNGAVTPVKNPDNIRLSNLIGYQAERKAVIDNTLALIAGKPAGNVLLYGDAGTGKSSTVKAIANEYKDKGLRIIEISKKQLREIPFIIDSLSINPLKFIIFIDDLSFAKDDDEFGELKAILEGSVSARTSNIAIYATSNRRHLVKETFSDRDGDDIHHNDTVQELISLSERFGLTVNFSKPDKKRFIDIVTGLAQQYGIDVPHDELIAEAEKFALRKSGRSPRTAKHFIEYMKTKEL
jgi:hypothetical protein